MRGSGEREAGQQRSVSANRAENNGQLGVEGPQLLKICSRDLAPKSRQLALVTTSLSAQAPRAEWVTGWTTSPMSWTLSTLSPSSPCWCAHSGLCGLLSICLHCTVSCPGAPIHRADPKPSMLQLQACADLPCCLSCPPDLEPDALAAQKYWRFPPNKPRFLEVSLMLLSPSG